ncbi:alpha/beta hydrolase [Pseudonocardia sp.]|uniref:alpha/beta fold hydrolase n=1 Tax=Pseudonocardia sp. TaxID=60912 RepID=UPI002635018C|nr:alpha/beta hydrolase [Pseudonocardia sp.]
MTGVAGSAPVVAGAGGAGPVRIVLVHGAWHDGTCWAPVVERLERRGHEVRVVDLPSERPEAAGRQYADTVVRAAQPLGPGERVVLVGHSLGGLTVPVAAEVLGPERVAALVLVAALVPRPGTSWAQQARAQPSPMAPGFGRGQVRHDDGTTSWPPDAAAAGLYAGVAAESSVAEVDAAVARLRRQGWAISREVTPLRAWPPVRTVRVICAEDRVVDAGWARSAAGVVPGSEVVELPGGHFPMLTRPDELVEVIDGVMIDGLIASVPDAYAADRSAGGEQ